MLLLLLLLLLLLKINDSIGIVPIYANKYVCLL